MSRKNGQVATWFTDAVAHHRAGRLERAHALYRQVTRSDSRHTGAWHLWGTLAHQLGEHEVAVERISEAIRLDPADPVAHLNLGEAYRALGRYPEASSHGRHALALRPDYPEAYNNLGLTRQKQGRLDEAREYFEKALVLKADLAEAAYNLARVLKESGLIDEAVQAYRQAVRLRPEDNAFHTNLIFALQLQPAADESVLQAEFEAWNRRHAAPLGTAFNSHRNSPDPARRLRIGYVSADFRQHPISFFLYPLFRAHDPQQVEVWAYSDVKQPDTVTAGLRRLTAGWRDTASFSNEALAAQIRADKIDVLVDLGMHTANNRLLTFAHRAAPVQVSWLAYPGTSGLSTIDYRLTDRHMDAPQEVHAGGLGGEPVRLPDCWCCYHPLGETPPVSGLPALQSSSGGPVTFGCLNNFAKINTSVLTLWAKVLAAVPGSRLLLYCPDVDSIRGWVRKLLAEYGGVAEARIEFVPSQGRRAYIQTYERIDIGLDPFPFNGMTTTCEALWMGVPVPALPGSTPGSRVGASLISTVGLEDLVARSEEEYLAIIASLASDLPRLARMRETMRARLEASPLMDAQRFARNIEHAYRVMWQRWCQRPLVG